MNGLPEGWQEVPLGDLLSPDARGKTLVQGWSPQCLPNPSPDSETWGVLKTTAIQAGRFDDSHHKELPAHLEAKPALEVSAGDLVMTNAGPRARCAVPALVRATRPRLLLSGKMYRFRPRPELLDARYLELWLLSSRAQSILDTMKTGISDSGLNLTRGRFLSLPVPHPPLPEQRRVVDQLEEHLSRLDAANASLDAGSARVQAWLARSRDHAVWSRPSEAALLGDLIREPLRNGHSAPSSSDGTGIRTLTLTAVTRGEFSDHHTKVTTADPHRVRDLWLKPGDILVQRSNTPELVGSAALYEGPPDWAIFPDLLIRVRVDANTVSPEYLSAVLSSTTSHRFLRSHAKGLAGSMPKIDQATIASTPVPVPSHAEQAAIVKLVDAALDHHRHLSTAIEDSRARSAALRQSLLQAAFTGKLTGHHSDMDRVEELALAGAADA